MADSLAEVHGVPGRRIVALEHPGIIRNFDNGRKSLGGEAQLKHVLEHHVGDSKLSSKQYHLPEPVAGVSLRPNDPLAKKIPSTGVETRNVLVKVTVPKRTGRKRKRGSDEPYAVPDRPEQQDNSITAPRLIRRLRDNEANYSITPVGMLRETHRFRMLPDFQLRNTELPIMRQIRDYAMVPDFNRFKDFRVDLTPGSKGITAFPGPPSFISTDTPYKYEYLQAPGVVYVQDEVGNITSKNISTPARRLTWGLPADVDEVPQGPPLDIPRHSPNGDLLPRAIKELQKILDERPLVTKRVALNAMPPCSETIFKEATQYVGYSFKAGPWRDSLIKYGVDPRKDPKYRFYQTLMFQVDKEAFKPENVAAREEGGAASKKTASTTWSRTLRHTRADPTTHIFDGKNITANGKTWQICDLTDPVVHKVFNTKNIRSECDVFQWGWFYNATMAKGRTIMKDKMKYLFAGKTPPEEIYAPLAEHMPDEITRENYHTAGYLDRKVYGDRAASFALEVRNMIKVIYGRKGGSLLSAKGDGEDDTAIDYDGIDADLREIDVGDDDSDEEEDPGDFGDMEQRVEDGQAEGGAENPKDEEAG
ncbi:hypothetical protein M409DRAFT_51304 [Zasmidium cellare ATCC 36951]|uniref:Transcription factor IIIC subunit 5 HTH domain-containing protein n=1 Tax=Zasmidium cellare ATCC 36951 TaxID=1080233 RepID=A0A6A6CWI4_ZASCE|nr:uncharacterized protein M409DRAFT_51304 [Zasmidium cellare ATCC 36951]KAF2171083.1 hypothetical protein M409DRAFT_51304 [Zasmidium cellare ATCC 36951]